MDAQLTDICIIGGGISGLVCAALLRQRHGSKVLVLEQTADTGKEDGKSVMFNASSAAVLAEVGAWSAHAVCLRQVFVSFGGVPGGTTIGDGKTPLGYGTSHHAVKQALIDSLADLRCAPASVKALIPENSAVRVDYETPAGAQQIRARLVVTACEWPGLPPPFQTRSFDYRQAIITFAAEAENWSPHSALENFGKYGIVTVVPRDDKIKPVGIIVCAPSSVAGRLTVLDDADFMQVVNDEFGGRLGLHSPSKRFVYAPQARHVRPLAAARIVCLGAGASVLHPAGAQGLNLGIADADCLSSLLANADDDQMEATIHRYARRRARAHVAALAATSTLALGGHLRAFPFRVAGGVATRVLSTALLPWRQQITGWLSGVKNIT